MQINEKYILLIIGINEVRINKYRSKPFITENFTYS